MMDLLKMAILIALLLLSVYYDLRFRKIPNTLLLSAFILSLIINIYSEGISGLLLSITGLLAGIALLIIPFSMGGIGAGDVKLLGIVGTLQGIHFVLYAFLSTALWGGVISILYLWYHKQLTHILKWIGDLLKQILRTITSNGMIPVSLQPIKPTKLSMPYAVPILLGTATILMMGVGL
jgi:prepilin peptidase CpaA